MSERVRAGNRTSELFSLATFILTLPRIESTDAYLALPGQEGEDWRIMDAVRQWNTHPEVHTLFVGGECPYESGPRYTQKQLVAPPYQLSWRDQIYIQGQAQNTREQIEWAVNLATIDEAPKIRTFRLFTAPFHMVRAYLYFVQIIRERNLEMIVFPSPTFVSPFRVIPDPKIPANSWALAPGEAERIIQYQERGWLPKVAEVAEYLTKVWRYLESLSAPEQPGFEASSQGISQ